MKGSTIEGSPKLVPVLDRESRLPLARPVDYTQGPKLWTRSCGQGDHPGSSRSKSERYKDFRLQYRSARRISVTESEDLGLSMWKQCVGMPRLPNKFQSRASIPRLDLCSFCSPDSQPNNCLHRLHSNSPDRLGKVSSFIFSFSFNSSSVSCSPPLEETQDLEFATCAGIALTILKPRSSNFFCGCRDWL